MTNLPADIDDAGIFAIVVLAAIATAAGLSYLGLSLWLLVPACVLYAVSGELAARKLAALKERQLVEGGDRS